MLLTPCQAHTPFKPLCLVLLLEQKQLLKPVQALLKSALASAQQRRIRDR